MALTFMKLFAKVLQNLCTAYRNTLDSGQLHTTASVMDTADGGLGHLGHMTAEC